MVVQTGGMGLNVSAYSGEARKSRMKTGGVCSSVQIRPMGILVSPGVTQSIERIILSRFSFMPFKIGPATESGKVDGNFAAT